MGIAGKESFMLFDELHLFAQQAVPRLDSAYWIMLVSRILHIVGAIILVGGLFYVRAVVSPAAVPVPDGEGSANGADRQFGGRRAAWAMWVGIATLLLLVTGIWNYLQMRGMHEKLASSYHMIAGIKMLLGVALFFLAALLAGRTVAAQSLRRRMRFWLTMCLILGILTVALGSVLRAYPRVKRVDGPAVPTRIAP
jgi:uncharacterized membrane protein